MKLKCIWVKFRQIGFHCYPDAPDEVAYLRDKHRHEFHYQVQLEVFDNDREVEFHMFKKELTDLYQGELDAQGKSCEALAEELIDYIVQHYPGRRASVDVAEDGECGASVVWNGFDEQTEG